jgi:hypothetical protein
MAKNECPMCGTDMDSTDQVLGRAHQKRAEQISGPVTLGQHPEHTPEALSRRMVTTYPSQWEATTFDS